MGQELSATVERVSLEGVMDNGLVDNVDPMHITLAILESANASLPLGARLVTPWEIVSFVRCSSTMDRFDDKCPLGLEDRGHWHYKVRAQGIREPAGEVSDV